MTVAIAIQVELAMPGLPGAADLRRWAMAALKEARRQGPAELVLRLVNEAEITSLNETYRHKQGPTNVLAFPFTPPAGVDSPLLGDVVICAPVAVREAVTQHKTPAAHWAHLVIHGVLHLLGYDHHSDVQAAAMEALEIRILAGLGFPDPYGDWGLL